MKSIVFVADNLEGGAARLAEGILLEWLELAERPPALLIHAGAITLPDDPRFKKIKVKRRGFIAAHLARSFMVRRQAEGSLIYNFTNFPIPNIFCRGKTQITLLHNAYLVTFPKKIYGRYPLALKVREFIKRLAFHLLLVVSNQSKIIVQSYWMKGLLQKSLNKIPFAGLFCVKVLPRHRMKDDLESACNPTVPESFWFYPAALYPHKNHDFILDVALCLKQRGSPLRIVITIDESSRAGAVFWNRVLARNLGDTIINTQWLAPSHVKRYLMASKGLFFPSTFESLGLPLLEALNAGKPIIAAATDLNAEITQGAAFLFEIGDADAVEKVVQAMEEDYQTSPIVAETLSKSSLIEAYVLSHVGSFTGG